MKSIRINLDNDASISRGLKQIEELINQIEKFPEHVADTEKNIAEMLYARADTADLDVTVSVEGEPNKASIKASGESVAFVEYGAGLTAETDPDAPVPTGPYSWSMSEQGSGKFTPEHPYWYYGGRKYDGTPSTRGLRTTAEVIQKDVDSLAEGYFK